MNTEPPDSGNLIENLLANYDLAGLDWRDPVNTAEDLRTHDDPNGTSRMVLDIMNTYTKEGPRWVPLVQPDAGAPFPLSIAVDVVTRLGDVVGE